MGPTERTLSIVSRCRDAGLPALAAVAVQRYLAGLRTLEWTSRYVPADAPWGEAVGIVLATEAARCDAAPELGERLRALCGALPAGATAPRKLIDAYAKTGADAPWRELHATLVALGADRAELYRAYLRTHLPLVREGALTELGRVIAEGARTHREIVRGAFRRASDLLRAVLASPARDLEFAYCIALAAREMDLGVCVALLLEADARRFTPFAVTVAGPDSLGDEIDRATALAALARHDAPLALDLAAQILFHEPVATARWRLAEPHATALAVAYPADPSRFAGALRTALCARHPGLATAAVALLAERASVAPDERAALESCITQGRPHAAAIAARVLLASEADEAVARRRALALREHTSVAVRTEAQIWLWRHAESATVATTEQAA